LGATRAGTITSATLRAPIPVFVGVLAVLGAALGLARTVSAVLYKAKMFDFVPTATSVVILLTIAFGAASIPALRVAKLDPARTLRND
ncbi:MAG: hypothetical protein ACJ74Y_16020, partial [Bryobacteraceae bacterium]